MVDLNQKLIDRKGKVITEEIILNFIVFVYGFRNLFKPKTLQDFLFDVLQQTSERAAKDEAMLKLWIELHKKVQKGGEVEFSEEELELLKEITPLRQTPWNVGQIFDMIGIELGAGLKSTGEVLDNVPVLNRKRTSAKSLEK